MTWSGSVVVHIECENESETALNMPPTSIVANRMTFVLLLYCNLSICIATINNIKLNQIDDYCVACTYVYDCMSTYVESIEKFGID